MVRPKQRKRDMRFCTWNIRSLYRAGSLTGAARELARYKLDLVGVKDKGGTIRARDYCSVDQIDKNDLAGNVALMGQRRGVYMVSVEKPEEKRPLGRPRGRWEDNI